MFFKRGDDIPIDKVLSEEDAAKEIKKYKIKEEDVNKSESNENNKKDLI